MSLIEYWKEGLALLTLVVGFLSGRKSKEFKDKTDGAGAIAALQKVYDTYIEHNKEMLTDLLERVKSVESHNRALQKHFNDISFSYSTVMDENRRLEAKYKELQTENTAIKIAHENLKKEFNEYKKRIQE